jgi:hypothetical protein
MIPNRTELADHRQVPVTRDAVLTLTQALDKQSHRLSEFHTDDLKWNVCVLLYTPPVRASARSGYKFRDKPRSQKERMSVLGKTQTPKERLCNSPSERREVSELPE